MTLTGHDPEWLTVAAKRCDQCLFSSAKVVNEARKAEILEKCNRDGGAFECHKFTIAGERVVCRAFYDGNHSLVVRLGRILNRVRFVDLPKESK